MLWERNCVPTTSLVCALVFLFAAGGCGGDGDVGNSGGGSGSGASGGSGSGAAGSGGPGGFSFGDAGARPGSGSAPGSGGTPTTTANCGATKHDLMKIPGELLVVLDRSGSMAETLNVGGQRLQKWSEVTGALDQVIMATQSGVSWGLKLFPVPNQCSVPNGVTVPVAPSNHAAIMGAIRMNPAIQNGGSTPTQPAVRNATAFMMSRQTPNPKYLLVATDGLPNCAGGVSNANDPMGAIAAVTDAAKAGLQSFIVGIATTTSNAHQTLNSMALAGGRPRNDPNTKYYPVQSRQELVTALNDITGQIASCTFNLSMQPPVPNNVAVEVDGMRIMRDTARTNGWDYGANNTSITIYGALCDRLKSGAAKNVQILFGCPGTPIP